MPRHRLPFRPALMIGARRTPSRRLGTCDMKCRPVRSEGHHHEVRDSEGGGLFGVDTDPGFRYETKSNARGRRGVHGAHPWAVSELFRHAAAQVIAGARVPDARGRAPCDGRPRRSHQQAQAASRPVLRFESTTTVWRSRPSGQLRATGGPRQGQSLRTIVGFRGTVMARGAGVCHQQSGQIAST